MQKSEPLFTLNNEVADVSDQNIEEVFKFWVATFGKRSSTVLDDARRKKLRIALKHYSEECKQSRAVASPHGTQDTTRTTKVP